MKPNILITGASGFIGSHVATRLEKDGYKVVPLAHKILQKPKALKKIVDTLQPQYIFHFSAFGNHSMQTDETKIITANINGTFNLLEATKDIPYIAFINIGTSSEYGKKMEAMKETDTLNTDTFYGSSKVASTYMARAFAIQYNKPIITVRPFSVYGQGEADHRFIPKMIKSILSGERFTITEGWHDWIYIDNLVDGIMHLLGAQRELGLVFKGQVYNIGTGIETSNMAIYNQIIELADRNINIVYAPVKPQDSVTWKADITKMKDLGWKPTISLEEGLKKCWEYYSKLYKEESPKLKATKKRGLSK
ncbi:MAG: NAD-dependent epimerase/dehydratase family protein [Nitrosotalea sp.]